MIVGLLLAGGDSSRMGQQKARLQIKGQEAWVHLANKMLAAGCGRVLMAIPSGLQDPLTPMAPEHVELHVVPESQRQRGAIGSLAHLITHLQVENWSDVESLLIAPVDHPYVATETLHHLLGGGHAVAIPTHGGKRGHPIVLRADVAARLQDLQGTLKTLTRDPEIGAIEIPVPDETILWNLDLPEDYDRFTRRLP